MLEMCTSALCCHYVMCDISWRSHLTEITLHLFTISYCPTALSRFASPSALLRTAGLVMVRMWRCFWQDGAVNCFRFADTLLADTASHHWLLGSFYCQDRVLWWYFVWISNTIWSYSQWDPVLPCPRMAQCSQCTLYSRNLGPSIWWTLKKLSSFLY